jgi:hypothetical protein
MPPSSLSPGAAASVERSADRPPRRWGLFATGTTLFAAGYVTDVGVTYGMGHANPGLSLIPILGPLIQLGDNFQIADPNMVKTGNPAIDAQSSQMINSGNEAYRGVVYTGLVLDAALQIAGLATAIAGAASHVKRPVRLTASGRLAITF